MITTLAPTVRRAPIAQSSKTCRAGCTTVTPTDPVRHTLRLLRLRVQGCQEPEVQPCQVQPLRPTGAVQLLLMPRRPDDIARFVVAVVILALQCVLRGRAVSYIREEVLPVLPPSFAHLDPPSSVAAIPPIPRVMAAVTSGPPGFVFWNRCHLVILAHRSNF